jgi:hypothetical protein
MFFKTSNVKLTFQSITLVATLLAFAAKLTRFPIIAFTFAFEKLTIRIFEPSKNRSKSEEILHVYINRKDVELFIEIS